MKLFKVGILGDAKIAQKYIYETLNKHTGFEIKILASKTTNNKYGFEMTDDYNEVINSDVDIIYIPLPNSFHYVFAKKALMANKSVIVEKPLASNFNEVSELVKIANKKNLLCFESFQFQFHDQFRRLKEIVESKIYGDIRFVRSSFSFPPFRDKNNIRLKKNLNGGALMDAGVYPIKAFKLINDMTGQKIIKVRHSSMRFKKEYEVDIWGTGVLSNECFEMQYSYGFDSAYECTIEIVFANGKVCLERAFTAPPEFEAKIKHQDHTEVFISDHFQNMYDFIHQTLDKKESIQDINDSNLCISRVLENIKEMNS